MASAPQGQCIIHADLDCFYVQVERRLDPTLAGVPCAVVQYNKYKGGAIIALSYEAKACGVKRSMRGDDARRLCPDIRLVHVPVAREKADLTRYRRAGSEVFKIMASEMVCERTSIDEAYADVSRAAARLLEQGAGVVLDELKRSGAMAEGGNTFVCGGEAGTTMAWLRRAIESAAPHTGTDLDMEAPLPACGDALLAAGAAAVARMRRRVKEVTGFTLSAGLAHNKMLAKLVSGMNKPNKQTIVPCSAVGALLQDLGLRELNGFGGKLGDAMIETHNLKTVGEVLALSREQLCRLPCIGCEKEAARIFDRLRGLDADPVTPRLAPKSIGCSKTFAGGSALKTMAKVRHFMGCLAQEVAARLDDLKQDHRQCATQLVVGYSTRSIEVRRKGVAVRLHSGGGGSRSCTIPSVPPSAVPGGSDDYGARLAEAMTDSVMSLLEREFAAHGQGADGSSRKASALHVTCLSLSASKLVDIVDPASRITRFFASSSSSSCSTTTAAVAAATNKKVCGDERRRRKETSSSSSVTSRTQTKNALMKTPATLSWASVDQDVLSNLPSPLQREVRARLDRENVGLKSSVAAAPVPLAPPRNLKSAAASSSSCGGGGEEKESRGASQWACSKCTVLNDFGSGICLVCGAKRVGGGGGRKRKRGGGKQAGAGGGGSIASHFFVRQRGGRKC